MSLLTENFEQWLLLGVPQMDETHREFVDLVNRMRIADHAEFTVLFDALIEHTQNHFDAEEQMMMNSKFPAISEHKDEHQRVLGELVRFGRRVTAGATSMSRVYVRDQLPQWFELHAQTMDSALAAHIKQTAG